MDAAMLPADTKRRTEKTPQRAGFTYYVRTMCRAGPELGGYWPATRAT
jgi:hypothetical protein